MTVERRSDVIPATGQLTLAGGGNLFRLLSASAAIEVQMIQRGSSSRFLGMLALILKRVEPWDKLILIGTAGTAVDFFLGTEQVNEDETDVPVSTVTTTGTVATSERPSDTVSDLAPVTVADASAASVVPASITRRRFSLQADTNNPGSCYARVSAGGNNIRELVAGVQYDFDTFDEIFVRNDTGGDCIFYRFEET